MTQRIQTFLRSPRGQQLISQGRQQLAKPENQRRLRGLFDRLKGQRRP